MLKGSFRGTPNQGDLIKKLLDFADSRCAPTTEQLVAALGWASSRQYVQEAVEALEGHGFLTRHYGREMGPFKRGTSMRMRPSLRAHHKWRGFPAPWVPEDLRPLDTKGGKA